MYQQQQKHTLDIIASIVIIIVVLPLGVMLAVLIKCTSRGPVFFIQERTGLRGEIFNMYKFRTMAHANDVRDMTQANLVTSLGRVMRVLSLDELPQMINILRGEMSFIGPRPWIPEYHLHMTSDQQKRVSVLPGITGLAQVHGRNSLSINQKLEYDLIYAKRISPREDAKIIFLTAKAVLAKSSHQLEKHGIHSEIELLKRQHLTKSPAPLRYKPGFREKL